MLLFAALEWEKAGDRVYMFACRPASIRLRLTRARRHVFDFIEGRRVWL